MMDNDNLKPADRAKEETAAHEEKASAEGAEPTTAELKASNEVEALRCEVEEWHAKADGLLDKYRRSLADFANYRKRQDREREEQAPRVRMDVLKQFLPVVDDFERALKSVPGEFAGAGWVEGITLIERKLKSVLAKFDVVPIEALGKSFDPASHSALMVGESDEYPAGVVMEELQRGYRLAEQVLRPTIVKVSKGPGPQKPTDEVKQ